jgi:hypothetical protein
MWSTCLAPTGEKLGLGTAIGGRLIPASQFEGAENQTALLEALDTVLDMVTYPTRSTDPLLLTYGVPFRILVTTPNNYPTTVQRHIVPQSRLARRSLASSAQCSLRSK